jgi:hypothetical protein
MANLTYQKIVCPHTYYADNPNRKVWRIVMSDDLSQIGFADFFVENNWSHFLVFSVAESVRNTSMIIDFIRNVYQIVDEPSSFWWNTPPVMEQYLDMICVERPDMTFAAGGAISKVLRSNPS